MRYAQVSCWGLNSKLSRFVFVVCLPILTIQCNANVETVNPFIEKVTKTQRSYSSPGRSRHRQRQEVPPRESRQEELKARLEQRVAVNGIEIMTDPKPRIISRKLLSPKCNQQLTAPDLVANICPKPLCGFTPKKSNKCTTAADLTLSI